MNKNATKNIAIIIGTALLCILMVWSLGFGFGNERSISQMFGVQIFGSEVYTGVWIVFMLMTPIAFGIPWLVNKFFLKRKFMEYGLQLGDMRFGILTIFILTPFYVLLPLGSANMGTETYYTYLENPLFLHPTNIAIHSASYVLFIFGAEFLLRGFVLFGLIHELGDTLKGRAIAVGITTSISALFLVGIPSTILLAMLVLSIPACMLNLRTRSFVYFAFINWNFGVWSDNWEIIKLNVSGG